jgi:streptomycin 3"-kinase
VIENLPTVRPMTTDPTRLLPAGVSWEPVAVGESGAAVFRRSDGAAYAKCAASVRDLRDERDRIAWLARTDLPCPEVVEWHEYDDDACLVSTAVDGIQANAVSAAAVPALLKSLARVIRRLHGIPVETCPFDRGLSVTLPIAENVVRRGAVNPDYLHPSDRQTPPAELLASLQAERDRLQRLERADRVVCHGDACLPNFLVDPDTFECVGLIDLGRLGVADRYLDLSVIAANLGSGDDPQFSPTDAGVVLRAYGLADPDPDRLRRYQLLDALSWG